MIKKIRKIIGGAVALAQIRELIARTSIIDARRATKERVIGVFLWNRSELMMMMMMIGILLKGNVKML